MTATFYLETDLNDYMTSLWKQFQDSTNETRNTGKGMDENQMMTEGVTVDKGELSSERECDVSVLIK